jgi:hypothetical protein
MEEATMKLPEIEHHYGEMVEVITAPVKSRILQTALESCVFDYLDRPITAPAVAKRLGFDPRNTELFLDALTACGWVIKENGMYRNTEVSGDLLVRSQPAYLGSWFLSAMRSIQEDLDDLPNLLKHGPPGKVSEEDMNSEEMCEASTEAHAKTELAGYASLVARRCAGLPGFADYRRMLDLGGGPGILATAVLSLHPGMKAVVFDRESVTRIARKYTDRYGMKDRISFLNGDYFTDPIGTGYDLIIASDTLYYPREQLEIVVQKAFDALYEEGVFIALHGTMTRERTAPESFVVGGLLDSMRNRGSLPDSGFLLPTLQRTGFRSVTTEDMDIPSGEAFEVNIGVKEEALP